jgi:hypothetical protein
MKGAFRGPGGRVPREGQPLCDELRRRHGEDHQDAEHDDGGLLAGAVQH